MEIVGGLYLKLLPRIPGTTVSLFVIAQYPALTYHSLNPPFAARCFLSVHIGKLT